MWPETVYPTTFGTPKSEDGAAFDHEIAGFVARSGVPLVFGSYDSEGDDEFNAAMLLEPEADGRLRLDIYRKPFLFPLTEGVPASFDSATVLHRGAAEASSIEMGRFLVCRVPIVDGCRGCRYTRFTTAMGFAA